MDVEADFAERGGVGGGWVFRWGGESDGRRDGGAGGVGVDERFAGGFLWGMGGWGCGCFAEKGVVGGCARESGRVLVVGFAGGGAGWGVLLQRCVGDVGAEICEGLLDGCGQWGEGGLNGGALS